MISIFEEDIKEKKIIVNSSRCNKSSRGNRHMLPIDFMSSKQRKKYIQGGEIKLSNIYDEILPLDQYNELPDTKKKLALEHWRKIHKTTAIKRAFGWNDYYIYKEFERLGIQTKKRNVEKKEKKVLAITQSKPKESEYTEVQILPVPKSGLAFNLDDEYTPEEAINKLMKIASFLEGESSKFVFKLDIKEIK